MPAKKKGKKVGRVRDDPAPDPEPEYRQAPTPANRGVGRSEARTGLIQVTANRPLGEYDAEGVMQRYSKGDVFYIDAARAKVLGTQVTETKG